MKTNTCVKEIISDVTAVPSDLIILYRPCVTRGEILSGVLDGTCGYDSIPVVTDAPVSGSEPAIDYDPEADQRLDRFDGVEMGISEMDEKTPSQLPGGENATKSEKKE